jgi:hypothetical protein
MNELLGEAFNIRRISDGVTPAGRLALEAAPFYQTALDVTPCFRDTITSFNRELGKWMVEWSVYFGSKTRNMLNDAKRNLLHTNDIRLLGVVKRIDDVRFGFPASGSHRVGACHVATPTISLPFLDLVALGFNSSDLPTISKILQTVADREGTQELDITVAFNDALDPHCHTLQKLEMELMREKAVHPVGLAFQNYLHLKLKPSPPLLAALSGKGETGTIPLMRVVKPLAVYELALMVAHFGTLCFFSLYLHVLLLFVCSALRLESQAVRFVVEKTAALAAQEPQCAVVLRQHQHTCIRGLGTWAQLAAALKVSALHPYWARHAGWCRL